jgi:hypothetical protein
VNAKERQEDRLAILEHAYEEIEKSGLGALAEHVINVRRALRKHMPTKWRVPYGFPAGGLIPRGKGALFITQPQVVTRFTHLVVTEDTAQYFVLKDYKIGKDSQLFDELDLTLFSLKYQENDFLSDLSTFRGDTAMISQYVSLDVRRKEDGHGPKKFSGILWAEFDL